MRQFGMIGVGSVLESWRKGGVKMKKLIVLVVLVMLASGFVASQNALAKPLPVDSCDIQGVSPYLC